MTDIRENSIVKCAYCKKDKKVSFVIEHEGETAYSLECFHRNTFCPTCNQMARDESETIKEVVRFCQTCDAVAETD